MAMHRNRPSVARRPGAYVLLVYFGKEYTRSDHGMLWRLKLHPATVSIYLFHSCRVPCMHQLMLRISAGQGHFSTGAQAAFLCRRLLDLPPLSPLFRKALPRASNRVIQPQPRPPLPQGCRARLGAPIPAADSARTPRLQAGVADP